MKTGDNTAVRPTSPETVAAIVTPPGEGGIGIVQVVGPRALVITARVFRPACHTDITAVEPGRLLYGRVVHVGITLDEAIVALISPGGQEGADPIVQINCHGGIAAVRAVLDCVVSNGARRAGQVELMARTASEHGLDTIRAQARRALMSACGERAAGMLIDQWNGALSREIESIASRLRSGDTQAGMRALRELLKTADFGISLVHPRRVVIAGAPNTGKSTLLNAIVGHPRVIVADVPGTTRDAVAETIVIDGIPFEIIDTAGLRDTDHVVEIESVKGSRRRLADADIVLSLFDASREATPEEWRIIDDITTDQLLPVLNKCELATVLDADKVADRCGVKPCEISALTGLGLDELETRLTGFIDRPEDYSPGDPVVFSQRQKDAITRAIGPAPEAAATLLKSCLTGEE